jgi:hypothetical protein
MYLFHDWMTDVFARPVPRRGEPRTSSTGKAHVSGNDKRLI